MVFFFLFMRGLMLLLYSGVKKEESKSVQKEKIVAVDLQEMAPIEGVIQIQGRHTIGL